MNSITKRRKILIILLLSFTTVVYSLPYLSSTFYNQFLEAYELSNTQAGLLMTMFSLTATPGYLFGGILADKFSPKKLILTSMLMTAALGIVMSFASGYAVIIACYFGFGISTTFIHWSAMLKLIRIQAEDGDEGKVFGMFETFAAIASACVSYGLLAILGKLESFRMSTFIYAAILIVLAILIAIVLKDADQSKKIKSDNFNIKMVGKAVAHPVTWLNGFIVMGLFILVSGGSYLNPYLTSVFGTSVEFGTGFAIANRSIFRILVVGVGGILLTRWKTPRFLLASCCAIAATAIVMYLLPQAPSAMVPATIVAVLMALIVAFSRSGMYTPIPEAGIPLEITGTAMGICSAVGYSTDLWLYTLCGSWIDKFGNDGYRRILLLYLAGVALVVVCSILLHKYEKKSSTGLNNAAN